MARTIALLPNRRFHRALWKNEKRTLIPKIQPNDCDEKCEYTIDSFLESDYIFRKRSLFFWKKQENHGAFFDFWQRYMVAKKVLLAVCRFSLHSLKKREKWFRTWNSGELFFCQPEYAYCLFAKTSRVPRKGGREQTAMKGTTHWQKTETWTTKCRGPPPHDCGFTKGFWKGGKLKKKSRISFSSTCGSIKWWSRTNL